MAKREKTAMSLEDDLLQLKPKPKQQGCKTCFFLADQTEASRELVNNWIIADNSTTTLHGVLVKWGYPYTVSGLKCHIEHVKKTRDA